MATSSKGSNNLDDDISKTVPKLLVTGDPEFMFYQTRVKIQDHFKNIQKSAQELESKLLNELDEYAEMHCNMLLETNSVIEQMTTMLNTLTDTQIKKNLNNNIDLLNKQKYINIDVIVDHLLSDLMNTTISINIEMASDSNIAKVLSSNPHPVMHYSKQKEMISLETLHSQFSEIKTLLAEPKYLEQGKRWYLIGRKWVEHLANYEKNVKPIDGLIPIPPPIDNSDIMDETESHGLKYHSKYNTIHVHKTNECIIEELVMGRDFAVFNEVAWDKLVEWYGIKEESLIFSRVVDYLESISFFENNNAPVSGVTVHNVKLIIYPRFYKFRFQRYINKPLQFCENITFFYADTELDIRVAIKRVLRIALEHDIIIFHEDPNGICTHPIKNETHTVVKNFSEIILQQSPLHPVYLVAVKCKSLEWLYSPFSNKKQSSKSSSKNTTPNK